MKRSVRERTPRQPAPIEHIELNEDKLHKRFILVVLLLALGLGAIVGAVAGLLRMDPGWQEVRADRAGLSCGGEFVLYYDLGRGETSAARENKLLQARFTAACLDAYALFDAHQRLEGVINPAWLSDHVNEETRVDGALYRAFQQLEASGSRLLYLAPVYEVYTSLFFAAEDREAEETDPFRQPELAEWCAQAAAYARDPAAIQLELLGEQRVRLKASEEYLDFLRQSGVTDLLDFFWMENAFQADYLAERLAAEGFTCGCLVSSRGCVRCLAPEDCPVREPFFHWDGSQARLAASFSLRKGLSAVSLRAYPLTGTDRTWFRAMPDGSVRSPYVDPADGLCRSTMPELTGLSESLSCAELSLLLADVFIGGSLEEAALAALPEKGAELLWTEGDRLRCTDQSLDLQPVNGFTK